MSLITISRSYGSGGSSVAELVAGRLGWELVDNRLVDEVAARAGLSRERVAASEERPSGWAERLARSLAGSAPTTLLAISPELGDEMDPARLARIAEAVIREVAARGHAVVVGRGAQPYLAGSVPALHVFVCGPREERIRRVAEREGLDGDAAARRVDETDRQRARYVKTQYGTTWGDPAEYDLTVNTAGDAYEEAADLIVAAARRRGIAPPPRC